MASKTFKLKLVKKRKAKSNKPNQKARQKIIDNNNEIVNKA
jgi:hypothetical protein